MAAVALPEITMPTCSDQRHPVGARELFEDDVIHRPILSLTNAKRKKLNGRANAHNERRHLCGVDSDTIRGGLETGRHLQEWDVLHRIEVALQRERRA
jgi:hypothetical protein